jgi:hypothetical protein
VNETQTASVASTLRFDQTVPRQLAHRRALGEVFVTDSAQAGEGEFQLALQVPRAHSLWFDRRIPYHDTLSSVEAARQAAFVVVHRHLGVPLGLPFSLQRVSFRVDDLEAYRDNLESPLEGVLRLCLAEQNIGAGQLGTMTFEGDLTIADSRAITVSGGIVFLAMDDYQALRAFQRRRKPFATAEGAAESELAAARRPVAVTPVAAIAPAEVGRYDERNVVIGAPTVGEADSLRFPLRVDLGHPSFFDHSYDHIPGPLLGEGLRQAALVTAVRAGALRSPVAAVMACEADFSDFGEFEAPVEISAAVGEASGDGTALVDLGVHQFAKQIATGTIELQEYPRD